MFNIFSVFRSDVKDDEKDKTIKTLQTDNTVLRKQMEQLIREHDVIVDRMKSEQEELKIKLKNAKLDSEVYRSLATSWNKEINIHH